MKAKAYYSDPDHCNSFIGRRLERGPGAVERGLERGWSAVGEP